MSSTGPQINGRGKRGKESRQRSLMKTAAEIALNERIRLRLKAVIRRRGITRPSRMVQEMIEGRHMPFCTPARRTLELIKADFPTDEVKAVMLDEYAQWIDEQAAKRHKLLPAA